MPKSLDKNHCTWYTLFNSVVPVTHLNFEGIANLDALHPLRAEHVVRYQLHLGHENERLTIY